MENPSLVETDYAFESALWFFRKNNLMALADQGVDDDTIKQSVEKLMAVITDYLTGKRKPKKIYEWLSE